MKRIGVLGLGRMGLPVAERLARAGFEVTGFDIEPARLDEARSRGLTVAATARQAAEQAEVLVTVLPGTDELRDAMLGRGAALAAVDRASIWLDLTSTDPRVAAEIAGVAAERGVRSVGAPMAGGLVDAAAGTLGFYVGGHDEAVQDATPVLTVLGDSRRLLRVGDDVRAGYTTKLLANTLWFGQAVAVTEALLLGQALGLDVALLRQALESSPGGSAFIAHHLDSLLAGDYLPSFGIDRVVEELDTVTSLAAGAGTPHDLTEIVAHLHREALSRFGPIDGELLAARLLEERAGRDLRASP